jgi:hypothetical protein
MVRDLFCSTVMSRKVVLSAGGFGFTPGMSARRPVVGS